MSIWRKDLMHAGHLENLSRRRLTPRVDSVDYVHEYVQYNLLLLSTFSTTYSYSYIQLTPTKYVQYNLLLLSMLSRRSITHHFNPTSAALNWLMGKGSSRAPQRRWVVTTDPPHRRTFWEAGVFPQQLGLWTSASWAAEREYVPRPRGRAARGLWEGGLTLPTGADGELAVDL